MIKKRNIIHLFLLISLLSCNKDNEFEFALIQTGDVTNIDSTGATFHARISDLSNSNILEYGFVWNTESNPEIHNSEKFIISGSPSIGIISERISTTLEEGVTCYVRAFIRNNNYITYGKEVAFTSLGSAAPEILDFYPKTGNINDTLHIFGKNFSYISVNNIVYIGNFQANVINAVQDTIVVLVPDNLNTQSSLIKVSILENEVKSAENFNLISPIIAEFEAKTGTFGSQISITGNNFLSNQKSLKVFFDKYAAEIIEIQNRTLNVIVPDSLDKRQCSIAIMMNNLSVNSTDSFTLESLIVSDFSPKIAHTGEILKLYGNNFSPITSNNTVSIGGLSAIVTKASINELYVTLPLQDLGYYPDRNVIININVIGESIDYNEALFINDNWFRRKDCQFGSYGNHNVVVIENKAYIGLNGTQTLYNYNPENNEWYQLATFPGEIRYNAVTIAINNKLYFGTGRYQQDFNDFWEYDPNTNIWLEKTSFPGEERTRATGFSIENIGYLGTGYSTHEFKDFYKYDPIIDEWDAIEPVPTESYYTIML